MSESPFKHSNSMKTWLVLVLLGGSDTLCRRVAHLEYCTVLSISAVELQGCPLLKYINKLWCVRVYVLDWQFHVQEKYFHNFISCQDDSHRGRRKVTLQLFLWTEFLSWADWTGELFLSMSLRRREPGFSNTWTKAIRWVLTGIPLNPSWMCYRAAITHDSSKRDAALLEIFLRRQHPSWTRPIELIRKNNFDCCKLGFVCLLKNHSFKY